MLKKRLGTVPAVCAAAVLLPIIGTGCSESQNWDWFGLKKTESKETKPVARSTAPAPEKTAAKPQPAAKPAEDPKAKEVDERVEQYVRSMNNRYDPSYVNNDFTAKIERQNDPDRQNQIRKTAARSRSDSSQYEPDWAPDTKAEGDGAAKSPTEGNEQDESAPKIADLNESTGDSQGKNPKATNERVPLEPKPVERSKTSEADPPAKSTAVATNRPATKVTEPEEATTPERKTERADEVTPKEKPAKKPPVLSDVGVTAAPQASANPAPKTTEEPAPIEANKPKREASPATPPVAAASTPAIDPIKAKILEQERLVSRDPNNLEEQFRLRMMYLVDGQDDKALAPTDGVNEDIQEIMRGQIQAMMSARSTSERDPATWANRQLDAIETLRSLVRQKADLRVPKVELCSAIDGFGRYEPISPPDFRVGARNLVLLYIEVDNFQCEKTASGMYRTLLSVRQSLLSKTGEELWTQRDENIEDLARQRRSDFYLTIGPLAIPKTLTAGEYVMKVEVEDVIAGKMNSNVAKFKMVP